MFSTYRIDEQIHKGLDRKVWLPSGGSLIIDRTEAMTVVDVNTGKFTGSGGNLEETVTKNNLEAAEEIVRQLRLRDIGGIIVVDFIDMVLESNRDLVVRRLVECLGRDRTRHQVAEVTSLGLVQMTRKRIGTGLLEAFSENCEHCQGRGVVIKDQPVDPDATPAEGEGRRSGRRRGRRSGDDNGDANGNGNGNGSGNGGHAPSPKDVAAMARHEKPAEAEVEAESEAEVRGRVRDRPRDRFRDRLRVCSRHRALRRTARSSRRSRRLAESACRARARGRAAEPEAEPEAAPAADEKPRVVTRTRRRSASRPAGPPALPAIVDRRRRDAPRQRRRSSPAPWVSSPASPAEAPDRRARADQEEGLAQAMTPAPSESTGKPVQDEARPGAATAPLRRVPWSARSDDRPWPARDPRPAARRGGGPGPGDPAHGPQHAGPALPPGTRPGAPRDLRRLPRDRGAARQGERHRVLVRRPDQHGAGLIKAAGDDDPGSYLIASWMGHLTGLGLALPRSALGDGAALRPAHARAPGDGGTGLRPRAGRHRDARAARLTWLVNGTVLTGTEYGLADRVSPTRVYALYGLPASLMFLSLVLVAYAVTRRPGVRAAVRLDGGARAAGRLRQPAPVVVRRRDRRSPSASCGGWPCVGERAGRWRPPRPPSAWSSACWLPGVVMDRINESRDRVVIAEASRLPDAHGTWHPLYLGLSYPQPITGDPSPFGVQWSDEFGWQKAREVDPEVVVASAEYDAIMKDLFLDEVEEAPVAAVRLYLTKTFFTIKHFAAMLVVILLAVVMVWRRRGPHKRRVRQVSAATVPFLLLGLVPTVLVMPMLYYFSELAAALGFLLALALGGLVWTISTLPSVVRLDERTMARERASSVAPQPRARLSVVVPTRNGEDVLASTLEALAGRLGEGDELVVVENGSTDGTTPLLESVAGTWEHPSTLVVLHSEPGLGNALRAGVLASRGERVLLTADDLPFGFSDLDGFADLPADAVLAVGSKAHPASARGPVLATRGPVGGVPLAAPRAAALRRGRQPGHHLGRRRVGRSFAAVSRESGLMWTVEMVLAAEQQGLDVWEVPVTLSEAHDSVASRFRLRDARIAVREISSLAVRRDDYSDQVWVSPGRMLSMRGSGPA